MKDFSDVFKGVVNVRRENGVYTPLRFSQKQLDRYANYQLLPACPYAYATANITMELITSAKEISFTYGCGEIWNWWPDSDPRFDIYENGLLRCHVMVKKEGGTVTYTREDADAPSAIKIALPHNAEISVSALEAGDYEAVPAKKRRLLVLSDSIGQGLMGNAGCMNYVTHLADMYDMDVLNQSVGGDRYDPLKIDENLDFRPTDVFICLGCNDCVSPDSWKTIRGNIASFMDKVEKVYAGCNITVMSPLYVFDFQPGAVQEEVDGINPEGWRPLAQRLGIFNLVQEEVAEKAAAHGFRFLNGLKMLPHIQRYLSDGTHPNDLGFAILALNLVKEFNK